MTWTEEDKKKMEQKASEAHDKLDKLLEEFGSGGSAPICETTSKLLTVLATWWRENKDGAGHKRLAYILMEHAPKGE